MSAASLEASAAAATEHLHSICQFSLNKPPMRPKVDRQSYDELRPGVDRALALADWFSELQQNFCTFLGELASGSGQPSAEHLTLLVRAVDACVLLENQFGGWSACINRFSWFKRTFAQIRREVVADDPSAESLAKDIPRFQTLIGNASYPIGMHLTGPLRESAQKVAGYERPLLAAVFHTTAKLSDASSGSGQPAPSDLRPLPYLLYMVDGDACNVFSQKLQPVQKLVKRFPMADAEPPPDMVQSLGLSPGHPVHLGSVLVRCPHYNTSMRSKWGMPKQAGDAKECVIL